MEWFGFHVEDEGAAGDSDGKIVVVGTIFMDIKGFPEKPFYPTGRNKGRIEYAYGGVARNVAEDLAGLGLHPLFVSMADREGAGAVSVEQMKRDGVITDHILRVDDCIGTWMVILTPEGDVCANLSKRQNLFPLCEYMREHGERIFADAKAVVVEMDVEEPVVAEVFSWAERYQIPVYGVISNMTIAKERIAYIQRTACFVCNRQEAGVLFDLDMEFMDPERILKIMPLAMQKAGIGTMVITMDKDGAAYASYRTAVDVSAASSDGETYGTAQGDESNLPELISCGICPAVPVEVVDTTGAGDSFFSGVTAGLIKGLELGDACKIGAQMAAQVISKSENVFR